MIKFLKSAVFSGILILLPVLFLVIILKEFAELLIGLATPIADLFPIDAFDSIPETNVLAALLLLGASFLVGLVAMVPAGVSLGRAIERRVLEKIPVYVPLKSLLQALLGSERSDTFKPALILGDSGDLEPAYIVEDTGRPRLIVLVPWTPASFAGSLRMVRREKVHKLDLTLDEFSLAIGHYGVGLSDLVPTTPEGLELEKNPTQDQ
jgi:uncharacterized membrane protein